MFGFEITSNMHFKFFLNNKYEALKYQNKNERCNHCLHLLSIRQGAFYKYNEKRA